MENKQPIPKWMIWVAEHALTVQWTLGMLSIFISYNIHFILVITCFIVIASSVFSVGIVVFKIDMETGRDEDIEYMRKFFYDRQLWINFITNWGVFSLFWFVSIPLIMIKTGRFG